MRYPRAQAEPLAASDRAERDARPGGGRGRGGRERYALGAATGRERARCRRGGVLGEVDMYEIQRQVEASRLTGEDLEHCTNTLIDIAARGVIGSLGVDEGLSLTFTRTPDTAGVEQVQQHALTFTYAPIDVWVRTQLQRQEDAMAPR